MENFIVLKSFTLRGQEVRPSKEGHPPTIVQLTQLEASNCLQLGLVQVPQPGPKTGLKADPNVISAKPKSDSAAKPKS